MSFEPVHVSLSVAAGALACAALGAGMIFALRKPGGSTIGAFVALACYFLSAIVFALLAIAWRP
jgi:hypothetical protein